jgi:demethylmenaquinone methyltransferase/2-methoxy-6-polyprenyl-1,4-benzoquinol methylase
MLDVEEGNYVLEIGFGTGQSILALAQSVGSSGRVWGIDISEGMISRSQTNISRADHSGRINLVCGDAMALPFRSGFCDRVFMSFALELFDATGMLTVLSECQRVLRDGGKICVVALAKQANPGFVARIYEWAHIKFPNIIDCQPIFVQMVVSYAGFRILKVSEMEILGLPVRIVLADK